jgi:hypothetical protein
MQSRLQVAQHGGSTTSSFLTDEEIKRLFVLFVPEAKASIPLKQVG